MKYSQMPHDAAEILDTLAEMLSGLETTRDALLSLRRDEIPVDYLAEDLESYIDSTREEIEHYNNLVNDAFEDEINDAIRDYWRAV